MAENILSPGVFQRETDESFISPLPVDVGAAIIGPTTKGPVEQPTVVSSYSDYKRKFGTTFESGSQQYEFLTSIAAQKFFAQGGNSMLVTRIVSGTFSSAESTNILSSGSLTAGNWPNNASRVVVNFTPADNEGIGLYAPNANGGLHLMSFRSSSYDGFNLAYNRLTYNSTDLTGLVTQINGTSALNALVTASVSASSLILSSSEGSDLSFLNGYRVYTGSFYSLDDYADPADSAYIATPPYTFTGGTGSIDNSDTNNTFTLKTIGKGTPFNNSTLSTDAGAQYSDSSLHSGSKDNLRWEITGLNTQTGTFNVQLRRGDDNATTPVILETFIGVNLDPNSNNYIAKRIGDQYTSITTQEGQSLITVNGDNPNLSKYVYVSSVGKPTPNYLNNDSSVGIDGTNTSYSASLPFPQSGSFYNALGGIIPIGRQGKYFQNIDGTDVQGVVATDYVTAINLLQNKDEYRFNTISAPGIYNIDYGSTVASLIELCETRGDAFYIADLTQHGSNTLAAKAEANELNSSYAGVYWPWVQVPSAELSRNVWVPTSTVMQGVYAYNDKVAAPWFAPAGMSRGGLPVIRAEIKLTQPLRDTLYTAKINPIATFPRVGVTAYGQKTLQTRASALDRVNVRRLLIALKNFIGDTSRNLVFDQNTTITRNRFLNTVNPYLESVQQRQGLYAFRVIMDETNNTADTIDRNQLNGQILIQPTKTAEFVILDYVIKPTGATFGE